MTDSIETSEAEAVEIAVPAPTNRVPGAKSVSLFFLTSKDGIAVELAIEGGGDTIDPRDPAHAVALFIQHNFLQLLPQAALWLQQLAVAQKAEREGRKPGIITPRQDVVVREPIIVDSSGQAVVSEPANGGAEPA